MRFAFAAALLLAADAAWARCDIKNDTGEQFTISSGNVSNQRVGSHTITSIAAGTITAKADSGKSVGGACKDGDKIKIVLEGNVLVIKPQ